MTFTIGQRVRCITQDPPGDCKIDHEYVVRKRGSEHNNYDDPYCGLICLEGIHGGKYHDRFVAADPIPPLVSETTFTVRPRTSYHRVKVVVRPDSYTISYPDDLDGEHDAVWLPDPIPATAQAILDIGKPTRSAGIARAIEGLQQRDWLLGAARWEP